MPGELRLETSAGSKSGRLLKGIKVAGLKQLTTEIVSGFLIGNDIDKFEY